MRPAKRRMPWYGRVSKQSAGVSEQSAEEDPESSGSLINSCLRKNAELQVEILTAEALAVPENRLKSLLGVSTLRAYVEATCGKARARTPVVEAVAGGTVQFGESLQLPLLGSAKSNSPRTLEIVLRVYHRRGSHFSKDATPLTSVLRPDPLIGEARISMGEESLGVPNTRTVWLTRARRVGCDELGRSVQGTLAVRVGVLAPHAAYRILGSCRRRKLAHVAKALAQVLAQPLGVELLMNSRPLGVGPALAETEEALRQRLQTWVVQLDGCVERLDGTEDDQAVIWHLARVVRAAQQLVAACGPATADAEEVQKLTAAWLRCLFEQCAVADGTLLVLDEARINQILITGRVGGGAAHQRLSNLGVVLPPGTSERLEVTLLTRLLEAEQNAELEMFTGEPVVANGRVARGLAVVTRPGYGTDDLHVFLYDASAIRRWVSEHCSDPITREPLKACEILPLTPESRRPLGRLQGCAVQAAVAMANAVRHWLASYS